jgi:hypothetical protein
MEKLEKLKKEREKLDKKIEALEYAERIFEEGDEIYYVDQFGIVNCGKWDNFAWIDAAFSQGHIFRTKQAAELESKRRNLLTRFKAFRDECNGDWKLNWNKNDAKYYLYKSSTTGDILCNDIYFYETFSLFGYFKNEEDAERAIKLFGQEIIELFVEGDA